MTSAKAKTAKDRRHRAVQEIVDAVTRGLGHLGEVLGLQPEPQPIPVRVRQTRRIDR